MAFHQGSLTSIFEAVLSSVRQRLHQSSFRRIHNKRPPDLSQQQLPSFPTIEKVLWDVSDDLSCVDSFFGRSSLNEKDIERWLLEASQSIRRQTDRPQKLRKLTLPLPGKKHCDHGNTSGMLVLDFKRNLMMVQERQFHSRSMKQVRSRSLLGESVKKTVPDYDAPKSGLDNIRQKFMKLGEPSSFSKLGMAGPKDDFEKNKRDLLKKYKDLLKDPVQDDALFNFADSYQNLQHKSTATPDWKKTLLYFSLIATAVIIALQLQYGVRMLIYKNVSQVDPADIKVHFNDVKGVDEAKSELSDVVSYLQDPTRFSALGGRLPKGVLLVGPPGCGKTLLARAVAGEAAVPFFYAAGSEFDEILVGQGAKRVRELFRAAKQAAPCVVFIDELDSVGGKRVSNNLQPFANQTINQLLAEMDGFEQNEGVIVIAATNRRDDLDKALLRPGRFDVEVQVNVPDKQGREEILGYYLSRIVLSADIDREKLARQTTGFSGADLENMVNQAALKAATDGQPSVAMSYLEEARDRVLMGPERKAGRIPDEEANKNTAYHEAGHTLVAFYTKGAKPLHKVTIIPRGSSLGHTSLLPSKDDYQQTKQQLLADLDVAMGGRVAEELIFGLDKITTGAQQDFSAATYLATAMVKQFGMSEKVGVRDFTQGANPTREALLGASAEVSQVTAELIDGEIKRLLQESYDRAKELLRTHAKEHKRLADALLEYETLDAIEIKSIVEGNAIRTSTP